MSDKKMVEEMALEFLAVAHEGAKKPLIALDIRTGNIGRQGVMWVETTTALAALEAAQAAATIAERRMEEMRAERDKWKQRAFELECEHGDLKGVFVEARAARRPSGGV
jgi:hypothetical protein